jgi:hypothetical protein
MKLDRVKGPFGKYVVFRSEDGRAMSSKPGDPNEVFVIVLKDRFAQDALVGYVHAIRREQNRLLAMAPEDHESEEYRDIRRQIDDLDEYRRSIDNMSNRAGPGSRYCKTPD